MIPAGPPAARLAVGDRGTAVAQETDLAGAGPVVPNQTGAVAGPADAGQQAAAADGERLRLGRELHDTIASAIAVIAIQAGVADQALERCQAEPQLARAALQTIRAASLQALAELQATVTTLRGKPGARGPRPGLAQLDALTSMAAAAGVRVELAVLGAARPLPPTVDLAAYRIVQEALTNVTRHAGPATATVQLTYRERDLTVQVDDDGRGTTASRPSRRGNGLLGMQERVAALGGRLQAGPHPGGGFRVVATIPLDGET